MARIRSIKPEFWEDETVALLSPYARLLFIATWNLADDEGLLRWTPAYIKAGAFMYDDNLGETEVKGFMEELVSHGLVFPYVIGKVQQKLGVIVNFRKHQNINRPGPGKLPPPSIHSLDVAQMYARRGDWICHLCGLEILRETRVALDPYDPNDFSTADAGLSLDHIVPRSQGGSDYPSNIAIAHLSCNKSRCDRPLSQVKREPTESVMRALTRAASGSVTGSVNESVHSSPPASMPRSVAEGSREQGTGSREQGSKTIVDPPTSARPASAHDPPLPVGEIFRSWLGSFGEDPTSTRFQLSPPRLDAITAALARYPFEDVRDAVRGWVNDPWPERAQQNDITQLLHMGSKRKPANVLEKMRDLWRRGPPAELGKRTRETVNNATQLRAVGIAKGVIGNGAGHELGTVGAARQPDQRELARPADRSADSG